MCRKLWMRRWEEYVGTRTLTRAYQNGMRDSAKPHSVREQVLQWEVENLKKIVVFGQKIKFKTILRSLVQVVLFTAMSSFKDPILQHCPITMHSAMSAYGAIFTLKNRKFSIKANQKCCGTSRDPSLKLDLCNMFKDLNNLLPPRLAFVHAKSSFA